MKIIMMKRTVLLSMVFFSVTHVAVFGSTRAPKAPKTTTTRALSTTTAAAAAASAAPIQLKKAAEAAESLKSAKGTKWAPGDVKKVLNLYLQDIKGFIAESAKVKSAASKKAREQAVKDVNEVLNTAAGHNLDNIDTIKKAFEPFVRQMGGELDDSTLGIES